MAAFLNLKNLFAENKFNESDTTIDLYDMIN